jgi:hypothetical protein
MNGAKLYSRMTMIDDLWYLFATETQKSQFLGDFPTTLVLLGCGKPRLTKELSRKERRWCSL